MRPILTLLTVLPLTTGCAFGWGCEGHQMIALIARAHLTPQASMAVDRLLRENPIDPALNRFCKDRESDLMADSATWADDARMIERTGEWHFIDIPLAIHPLASYGDGEDVMKWCGGGCIVSAIDHEWALLRDKNQSAAVRAKALRYLIHLVGDLAQPLHASDNHDRGGNCTEIRFFTDEKPENLHAIWDYEIIARDLHARKMTQAEYASGLDGPFSESKIDIPAWTWESHALAFEVAYGNLKPPIPISSATSGTADQTACAAERAAVGALHISIDDEYTRQALPVIREELAKAGHHLAALLNQTFQ
jgi:hypothetical protein